MKRHCGGRASIGQIFWATSSLLHWHELAEHLKWFFLGLLIWCFFDDYTLVSCRLFCQQSSTDDPLSVSADRVVSFPSPQGAWGQRESWTQREKGSKQAKGGRRSASPLDLQTISFLFGADSSIHSVLRGPLNRIRSAMYL